MIEIKCCSGLMVLTRELSGKVNSRMYKCPTCGGLKLLIKKGHFWVKTN